MFSAVSLLEQTCDIDPQPTSLLKLAKLMLLNPNWVNRALEKLRRAVEIDPSFVDGWVAVADFWHERKSAERERKAIEKALAADPENERIIDRYRRMRGSAELAAFLDRVRGGDR
jgi:Tfp pilus assembly protein PilF